MHSIICPCGNTIVIVPPSEHAGYLVWDNDVDLSIAARRSQLQGFLEASARGDRSSWLQTFYSRSHPTTRWDSKSDVDVIEDILSRTDVYTRTCYRCPLCRRMYVEKSPDSRRYMSYQAEGSELV